MAECHRCKGTIRGESGIKCEGVCGKIYHSAAKCSEIDQYSIGILNGQNYIRFMCDDCVQYIHNIDEVLCNVQDGVQKNQQQLSHYKNEFETSLKQNELEIKQLLEAIEKRYDERIKKLDKAFKMCDKNIQEIRNLNEKMSKVEDKGNEICKSIENNNLKLCNEIKNVIKETNIKTNQVSYAQTLKTGISVMPDITKKVPLIIKPKEKQNVGRTKEELNNKVDPVNLKISGVESRRNGTVVIQTENDEERNKIKTAIEKEMSKGYEIKVPNPIEMKIDITDMNFKYDDKEIIEKIKKQNNMLRESELSVIKMYEIKRNNRTIYNAKLKVDNEAYKEIMREKKINIGWDRCRVFDGTEVLQCFKCHGYNHRASECRNNELCLKCHEGHKTKECNKESIKKCINCLRVNKKLNLGLDDNHYTMDRQCPVYQNKLNNKKKQIGLNF